MPETNNLWEHAITTAIGAVAAVIIQSVRTKARGKKDNAENGNGLARDLITTSYDSLRAQLKIEIDQRQAAENRTREYQQLYDSALKQIEIAREELSKAKAEFTLEKAKIQSELLTTRTEMNELREELAEVRRFACGVAECKDRLIIPEPPPTSA